MSVDVKDLFTGIGVVIDDVLGHKNPDADDLIHEIVGNMEELWNTHILRLNNIPDSDDVSDNLCKSASFILLDWQLWGYRQSDTESEKSDDMQIGTELEKTYVEKNLQFLQIAKRYFVPVFVFTNTTVEDVKDALSKQDNLYYDEDDAKNFIFVQDKSALIDGEGGQDKISQLIGDWLQGNASVYTLKVWENSFLKAKSDLFASMYGLHPDWPKVFWKSYTKDGVDPGVSLTGLINDSLIGRMRSDGFDGNVFNQTESRGVPDYSTLRKLHSQASFVGSENLAEDDLAPGDLFKIDNKHYYINIRPACDCVLRENDTDVEIYCLRGFIIKNNELKGRDVYNKGHFIERSNQGIVFAAHEQKSIKFSFKDIHVKKYSEVKEKRVGRLIHPYITRIQQRYALYLQRQGLPRIPEEAISGSGSTTTSKNTP